MKRPWRSEFSSVLSTGVIVVLVLTVVAAFSVSAWVNSPPPQEIVLRTPFMDGRETRGDDHAVAAIPMSGVFTEGHADPLAPLPGVWPGFRGPLHDNIVHEGPPLLNSFPDTGPAVHWRLGLGEGYAGAAVRHGRVYVLDYDEENLADTLRCLSLRDGREIWRRAYPVRVKRNHGMSRTTPAVSEDSVVSLGPKCHVLCVDAQNGDYRWGLDLVAQLGSEVPLWYAGQCPLIDGQMAILAPAGSNALLVGVNTLSGEVEWRTPNPHAWKMSHASVIPMELAHRRMYVYPALGGMVGVAADGPERGKLLWETTDWSASVLAPSAVPIGNDRLLVTAGYGAGSAIFQVSASNGTYSVSRIATLKKTEFACEQQTPILYKDHMFTIVPGDGGALGKQLICTDIAGKLRWNSGKTERFGLGPFLIADDKIWVLDDDGMLSIISASTTAYQRLGQAKVLDGHESWAPMALVGTRLILRDSKSMICLDLSTPGEDA